ncbi:unnamed protein product [Hyaloperonospora brassicae]|uniref:Tower domain-containing protein n=1 Tax=Hyaloperonospora brassicae TaxID=162125 RepID=A0AAV0UVF3_HYABA|nr:unnamed protein product [Hyaloperonospora brassicae]
MSAANDVWRDAFAELLVFDQDFDTALQIMVFQDTQVAQLALENTQQTTSQRARRNAHDQSDGTSFCSDRRKRRRVGVVEVAHNASDGAVVPVRSLSTSQCGELAHHVVRDDRLKTRDDSCGGEESFVSGEVPPQTRVTWENGRGVATGNLVGRVESRLCGSDDREQFYSGNKIEVGLPANDTSSMTMSNEAVVPSLFSTGSGKPMLVSKSRLRAYEEKLYGEDASVCKDTAAAVAAAAGPTMNNEAVVPSLFSTGSGKPMLVSKSRLRAYEEKLYGEDESVCKDTAAAVAAAAGTTMNNEAVVPSLLSTGLGKPMSVSKLRLRAYEEKLYGEDESVCKDTAAAVAAAAGTTMNNEAVVPSLFSTGSGKPMLVSKSRLRAYEEKLYGEDESVCKDTAAAVAAAAGTTMNNEAVVPSLFSTGSGKPMLVSKLRLRAYEEKLYGEDESVCKDTAAAVAAAAGTTMNNEAVVPSLFSTGSGKPMLVSKSRLRAYEEKLYGEDESVCKDTAAAVAAAAGTTMNNEAVVPSLFSTGSGKPMLVSKSRLRAYEEKLYGEDESVCKDTAAAVAASAGTTMNNEAVVPSLFSTGSGKPMLVSKSRLRAYEEKLYGEDASVCKDTAAAVAASAGTTMNNEAVVPSLFSAGSGKPMLVSKSRLRAYEEKLYGEDASVCKDTAAAVAAAAGTTMNNEAVVPSLFSTGSGKPMLVSKSRLRAYEEKLYGEDESVCKDTAAAVAAAAGTTMNNEAVVPSLFSTGSGKPMLVSKSRLRAYEEKLYGEDESVCKDTAAAVAAAAGTTMNNEAVVPSLFSTGSGKPMLVSKSRLRAYEEKLYGEDESVCKDTAAAVAAAAGTTMNNEAVVPSLFSTESGKPMLVSKSRLRAYEEKLCNETTLVNSICDAEDEWVIGPLCKGSRLARDESRNDADQVGDLRSNLNEKLDMQSIRSSLMDENLVAGRQRGATASSSPSRTRLHHRATLHSSRTQRLHYGDKENIHPEYVPTAKTAASKPCKVWRSISNENRPSTRPIAKFCGHHCLRQQGMARRVLLPFVESRPEAVGKVRFYPPVPSKTSSACNAESGRGFGRFGVSRSEKKQRIVSKAQPFIYQESMTTSLPSLMELHRDRSLVKGDHDLYRRQILNVITAENAVNVRFMGNNGLACLSESHVAEGLSTGPRELYRQITAGKHILKKMGATFAWFLNHYRWVVWKLAAMERSFPRLLLETYLTKDQVLRQISYRYQRDVTDAKRSIIKKILNRDASSLSCVVLCIAAVLPYPVDKNDLIDAECPACFNLAVVLTDGWYSVYAVPDVPLATVLWNLHAKSGIVGTKIAVWNASLQNSADGIDPLECAIVRESQWKHPLLAKEDLARWPYLRLRYNSTRRVRFGTRLGMEKLHYAVSANYGQYKQQQPQLRFSLLKSVPLRSLEVGGGMVRAVRVRMTRVSPILYLQAKDYRLGPRILCDEQLPVYFQLRSEYARAGVLKNHQQDGADIVEQDRMDHDPNSVPLPVPFIKVDVECTHTCTNDQRGSCYGVLTVWRPPEELLCGRIKEGVEYFVSSLNVRWKLDGGRGHDAYLQLSSTKHSTFDEVHDAMSPTDAEDKNDAPLKPGERVCVDIQQATNDYRSTGDNGLSSFRNDRRPKIDVCVYVVLVTAPVTQDDSAATAKRRGEASLLDPAIEPTEIRYVKHVFVTDESCHLMSIRVSGVDISMPKLRHNSPSKCVSSSSFVFCRGNKSVWKEGSIVCLSGLEISHYDERLDVLDCILVESTQIMSFPSKNSPFQERYSLLQCEAGKLTKRLSAKQALPTSSSFGEELARLKKRVQQDILKTDFVSFQESNEQHATIADQKRVIRVPKLHEAEGATDTAGDDEALGKSSRLLWKANVINIKLLTGNIRSMFPGSVIACACVNVGTDDGRYRTVYLTREAMFSMQTLLEQAGTCCREKDGGIGDGVDEDVVLVAIVSTMLRQIGMNYLFCFEVKQMRSERLASSWKPWEHLHASYWLAKTITAGKHCTSGAVYTDTMSNDFEHDT